ncbi:DUF551 domain-containing protein [Klebsiella pneumoniae]|uniref:DUF551 domain-containing protein n=1 Tax=Klebsiella pneumoniae TaxID=573 RepID=UPI004045483F
MSDEIETIDKNPKSWAAWKREAERLQAIIDDMALVAMDSEPVIIVGDDGGDALSYRRLIQSFEPGTKLYRHAQQPVVPKSMSVRQAISALESAGAVTTIGQAYKMGWNACRAAMIAAAPHDTPALNSLQSVDSVTGGWIPVSERIPDNTEPVLCIEKRADFGTYGQPFVCWHDGGGWVGKTNYRPIVTHWMPLPADPQEVK